MHVAVNAAQADGAVHPPAALLVSHHHPFTHRTQLRLGPPEQHAGRGILQQTLLPRGAAELTRTKGNTTTTFTTTATGPGTDSTATPRRTSSS
jgi:hypothetical protein